MYVPTFPKLVVAIVVGAVAAEFMGLEVCNNVRQLAAGAQRHAGE